MHEIEQGCCCELSRRCGMCVPIVVSVLHSRAAQNMSSTIERVCVYSLSLLQAPRPPTQPKPPDAFSAPSSQWSSKPKLLVMSSNLPQGMSRPTWCLKDYIIQDKIYSGTWSGCLVVVCSGPLCTLCDADRLLGVRPSQD